MSALILILSITTTIMTQNYQVSLDFPFLIDNNRTNIKHIGSDFTGSFLVSLENGQGRRYDSTFTSYVNFTMPEAATFLSGVSKTINGFVAQNGTSLTSNGQLITSMSNQQSTVRDYDYGSLTLLESYTIIDLVNYNYLLPLNISDHVQGLHLLYCQSGLKIGFDSTIMDIAGFYPSGGQNYDVEFQSESFSVGSNLLNVTVIVYLTQSANQIYFSSVTVQLQYDPAANKFVFVGVLNVTNTLLMTTAFQGTSLLMANGLLLIQNKALGSTAMYNTLTNSVGTVSGFSLNEILLFFFIFNQYYALQINGLALISFNSGTNSLSVFSLTIPLLTNRYGLSPGNTYVDPFYIVDQPYVYKSGRCSGQTLLGLGNICISYSCLTPYCSSCPFTALTCGVCNDGYYKTGLLLCLKGTTTTSSSSNTSSTTNPSNSNVNGSTSNSLYYSSSNESYSNGSSLSSLNSQEVVIYFVSEELWNLFLAFLTSMIGGLKKVIAVPAARSVVSPLFCYFGIFDDIYLYQFHDRVYGATMNQVFSQINQMQVSKWSIFTYGNIISLFNGNPTQFDNFINYQSRYLSYNWTDFQHTYLGSEGLLINSQNFFVAAIPLVFLGFVFFKFLFRLLWNYPVSKLLRKFDFWIFYPLLIFQGNIQQFSFFTTRDLMAMFSFDLSDKVIKVGVVFFGFIVLLYSCSIYLLGYGFYKKLNTYFSDNNKNCLAGCFLLLLQNGFKNMLLGEIQAVLRPLPYGVFIFVLIGTEIFFLFLFLMSITIKIYKNQIRIWIYLLLNAAKIILLLTLYWDYGDINLPICQQIEQTILFFLTLLFCLGIFIELILLVKQFKHCLKKICCQPKRYSKRQTECKLNKTFKVEEVLRAHMRRTQKKKKIRIDSLNSFRGTSKSKPDLIKGSKSTMFQETIRSKKENKKYLEVPRSTLSKFMLYKVIGSEITSSISLSSTMTIYTWKIQQ